MRRARSRCCESGHGSTTASSSTSPPRSSTATGCCRRSARASSSRSPRAAVVAAAEIAGGLTPLLEPGADPGLLRLPGAGLVGAGLRGGQDARRLVDDRRAMGELALVVAHRLD